MVSALPAADSYPFDSALKAPNRHDERSAANLWALPRDGHATSHDDTI